MSRKASSPTSKKTIVGATASSLLVLLVGYFFFGKADSYRGTSFPQKDYLENATSLRGNTYILEGKIDKSLEISPAGRLFSIEIDTDTVPIFIPTSLNFNIERGQKLRLQVQVTENGQITTTAIQKI
jgi:hypothetical protein